MITVSAAHYPRNSAWVCRHAEIERHEEPRIRDGAADPQGFLRAGLRREHA